MNLDGKSVSYISIFPRNQEPSYFVYWILGNTCTYKCSYCPEFFHSGSHPYHPTDVVINAMKKLPKNTHLVFGGGEPTFHPEFEKIIENKPEHVRIGILSNASRPFSFWERVTGSLSNVILSYHIEYAKLDRFLETAKYVYHTMKRYGRINFPMPPNQWDKCVEIYDIMIKEGLPVTAKPIVDNFGPLDSETSVIKEYTTEQLNWIYEANLANDKLNKSIGVYDKDHNIIFKTNASELIAKKQTNFKGWECHVPVISREILANGSVVTMGCQQRTVVGSIFTDFTLVSEPEICRQNMCWCHADIQGLKIKND